MTIRIPELDPGASETAAARWLRAVVRLVGPGFHIDTAPGDYVDGQGRKSFAPADAGRMERGLRCAAHILGRERFEQICLRAVWRALGVRYDAARNRLVPVQG